MTQARARALAPSTKRRMPWIALGLLLVFGSGLGLRGVVARHLDPGGRARRQP